MIPVTVERNFKPDGWLGMLVGSKVWLDFTEDSKFEGHMQMLTRQLGEKGKSEQVANNVSVDGKASAGELFYCRMNRNPTLHFIYDLLLYDESLRQRYEAFCAYLSSCFPEEYENVPV